MGLKQVDSVADPTPVDQRTAITPSQRHLLRVLGQPPAKDHPNYAAEKWRDVRRYFVRCALPLTLVVCVLADTGPPIGWPFAVASLALWMAFLELVTRRIRRAERGPHDLPL
jgi:hypothetical protein